MVCVPRHFYLCIIPNRHFGQYTIWYLPSHNVIGTLSDFVSCTFSPFFLWMLFRKAHCIIYYYTVESVYLFHIIGVGLNNWIMFDVKALTGQSEACPALSEACSGKIRFLVRTTIHFFAPFSLCKCIGSVLGVELSSGIGDVLIWVCRLTRDRI